MKFLLKYFYPHKETISNLIWRSLQIFGKQGITFLIFIFCIKILNPYDFGLYNYMIAIVYLLIMLSDFGISTSTSKYVSEYNITDKNKLQAVLFNSGFIIFILTLIITILTLIIGPLYLKDKYVYVLYLLPMIFLAPITSLYDGIYRGLKRFKELALISLIIGLISIPIIYFLVKYNGLIGALIAQNLFYLILMLGLGFRYKNFNFKFNKEVIKEISKYSLIYGLAVLGNYLFIRVGILILGHYNYIIEIGMYELFNKFFTIFLLPFIIIGQVVAPNFTELHINGRYDLIYLKLKKYTIFFIITGLIIGLLIYFILPLIIYYFLPIYYNSLFFNLLPWLTLMYILNVFAATIDFGILIPIGQAKIMSIFYVILGIIGSSMSLIFVNMFGYMGVIYSFTISTFIMVIGLRILLFVKVNKKLNSNF